MAMEADSKRSSNTNNGTAMGIQNRMSGNFNVSKRKNEGILGAPLVRFPDPTGAPERPAMVCLVSNATTSLLDIDFYFCVLAVYVNDFSRIHFSNSGEELVNVNILILKLLGYVLRNELHCNFGKGKR